MANARQELGPDALLVNTRKAPPEARHLGEYEVVFAALAPGGDSVEASTPQAAPPHVPAQQPQDRLSVEVAELKKELQGMRRVITRTAYAPGQWVGVSQDFSDAYALLTASEVSPDLAREIVQGANSRLSAPRAPLARTPQRPDPAAFERALVEEIASRFTVEPVLGRGPAQPRIVALAGPPGAGKTTTLVKLAVNYGLAARRPVLLLSMDTFRVGFQILETVTALAQAIEENRSKELIFIDTAGMALGELEESSSLARFLSTRGDIDTHLVLSASMKPADLSRMVDAFEILKPQRLLFTKLDETSSFGPILNEAARTGKPLSFFTAGQRIPEDLEVASQNRVLDLVLAGQAGRARAAA